MSFPETIGNYTYIREIGCGGFSIVALVQHNRTHEYFAGKMINRKIAVESGLLFRVESELRIHEFLSHDGIIKVQEVIYTKDDIFIIMEYGERGTLYDYICAYGIFNEHETLSLFTDIVNAIEYIHGKGITHRDLKLDNVVLTKAFKPKLIDFGFAHQNRYFDALRGTVCGTLEYMSPEIILGKEYDPLPSDIWSLGVCLYVMVFGVYPWIGSDSQISQRIVHAQLGFPVQTSPLIAKLLKGMLEKDPSNRLTAKEIKQMLNTKLIKEARSYRDSFSPKKHIFKPCLQTQSFKTLKHITATTFKVRNTSSQPF